MEHRRPIRIGLGSETTIGPPTWADRSVNADHGTPEQNDPGEGFHELRDAAEPSQVGCEGPATLRRSRRSGGIDGDLGLVAARALELDLAVDQREQGPVAADADVGAGVVLGADLANQDTAGLHDLPNTTPNTTHPNPQTNHKTTQKKKQTTTTPTTP